jgi:Tfp pilus assembly protein PilO
MALDYKSGLSRYRRYLQVVQEQPLIRAGIWTGLSLVLVIVMIVAALKPTLVVIANLFGEIRQDKEIVLKLNDKILKIQQATSEMDRISPKLPILDTALPVTTNWETWTEEITNIASQSGAKVLTVTVGPAPITGKTKPNAKELTIAGVNNLSFSLSASGSYDQLKQIVRAIENTPRLNVLSEVQFTTEKDKASGSILTVYIKGIAVYSP